jgi:hypothetical protein
MPFHLTGEPHLLHAVVCHLCGLLRPFDTKRFAQRALNDLIITGAEVSDREVQDCACEGLCACDHS